MSVYCVTGKLGSGKSLVCVGRIRDAIRDGLRIATNLDIDLKTMFGKQAKKIDLVRIPDKPVLQDLQAIGKGATGDYDEKKFGLLILDECGTWFNSRNWQDKDRKPVNDWFLHARKLGWHVYIIIQDITMLDSQARDAICELLVECRRLDKVRIPLIGSAFKLLTGINLTGPRMHRAKVMYSGGIVSDVWWYRGNELFDCYDTRQTFLQGYPHGAHTILPPWYTHGRYTNPLTWSRLMRLTKIHWKRFKSPVALATGLLLGLAFAMVYKAHDIEQKIVRYELEKHQRDAVKPVQEVNPGTSGASSSSSSSSAQDSQATKVNNFLANLRITGSKTVNAIVSYTFNGATAESYYSSEDLLAMGFKITPLGDCQARIELQNIGGIVRCF